jgi:hypothetical protein
MRNAIRFYHSLFVYQTLSFFPLIFQVVFLVLLLASCVDLKNMLHEVDTQTESDMKTTFSMENDTLRSRNIYLQRSIAELKERLNQEVAPSGGNILTNVACTALFPEEKYYPVGSDLKDQYTALRIIFYR